MNVFEPKPNVFERGLKLTVGIEKGYSNHPADRGGATMYGVTQTTYDRWRRTHGLPTRPVIMIEWPEVETIYKDEYWVTAHCDMFEDRLALCVFDASINHGPVRAIKLLQTALKLKDSGLFDTRTCNAATKCDEQKTVASYLDARQTFFDNIIEHDPTQVVFKDGWHNRILKLRAALLDQP